MFDYYIDTFNIETIRKCISSYKQKEAIFMRKQFNYYNGKMAISLKTTAGDRPNNQVVSNFCKPIADSFLSFIKLIDTDALDSNEFMASVRDTVICGTAYQYFLFDDGMYKNIRLKPTRAMVIRDTTPLHAPVAACMWNEYHVYDGLATRPVVDLYVFDAVNMYFYSGADINTATLRETTPHNFKDIPIVEMHASRDKCGVFLPGMQLNDAYNLVDSSFIDGRETFSDAFLVISGLNVDEDTAASLINGEEKLINLPLENAKASYLVKDDDANKVIDYLDNLRKRIFAVCSCVDPSDSTFGTYSGLAIKLKFSAFIQCVENIKDELTLASDVISDILGAEIALEFEDIDIDEGNAVPSEV